MSLLDSYSGYNQILVHEDDRDKTTFTTPWGTFHYAKMPFGLKNAGDTFQRAMDVAFANEKDKICNLIESEKESFCHDEGKLLGHIISKDDIRIDPARVEAIQQIEHPWNKKEIQSFNGKLNFLRRFIPNIAEHLREITSMLKKDSQVKWTEEAVKSFNLVKLALSSAPILISPDYTQDFILFSFAYEHTLAVVLMQKREAVKDILVHADPEGRSGKWIAALLEYDVEIKPTKLIKGQGLAKLMAQTNLQILDINLIAAMSDEDEENPSIQVFEMFLSSPWYADILYVLQHLSSPPGMPRNRSRTLKLKATKFCILDSTLFWKDPDGMLLNCLVEEEAQRVVEDFHRGDCGGHLFWKTMANKILRAGYYWPSLFLDVYKVVKNCHECQNFQGKQKLQPLLLKPIEVSAPFQQWGLDFIGEIHPASSGQNRWILTATDYFTKWIEEIPTRQATYAVIISFLETNILSHFGCTSKLIMDNAAVFKSKRMIEFCYKYNISLGHSTAYHPQGNGLAESSNKSLVNIIKKLLEISKKGWHHKLINALWADRVSKKNSIGMSPFDLVYETDTVFPTSLAVPVVKLLQEVGSEEDPMQRMINQMIHLQQTWEEVFQNTCKL
eukprot:PITA_34561